jgi:hypothetical protein
MSGERRTIDMGFTKEPFPEGTHMCFIYNDEDERRETIAQFLQSGLKAGEKVVYLVDQTTPEEMRAHLSRYGLNPPATMPENQLAIVPTTKAYIPDGTFKVERMLNNVSAMYTDAIKSHFVGARASGEMEWALRNVPGSEGLIEYESRLNIILVDTPTTAICQYDARKFSGSLLFDVLSVHPMMVVRGSVVRNPYYIPPETFLKNRTQNQTAGLKQ